MTEYFKHGNECPNSTKCGKFLEDLSDYKLLNKNSSVWEQFLEVRFGILLGSS
jgi:hypothetical protein